MVLYGTNEANIFHRVSDVQPGLRLDEAMRLQEIEGNPLSHEDVAMFEMFEREQWPREKRRAYILAMLMPVAAE